MLALKGSWRFRGGVKDGRVAPARFCDPSRTSGPSLRFRRGKKPGRFQFDRENGSGKVWESIDEGVTTTTLRNLVEKIASSETVKLRFEGDGVRDFEVPEWQLVQFREMLAAYQATNESHSP